MKIDLKDFREHYASLSDNALLDLDRAELVEAAQQCYDEELARRNLVEGAEILPDDEGEEAEPDWRDDAACACTFRAHPGDDSAAQAGEARAVLQDAGIPCVVAVRNVAAPASEPQTFIEYEVRVPAKFNLQAAGVLDKEIFNAGMEDDWRIHFEALSDEDLQDADPQDMVAGLLDRIERLTRIYREELERRGFETN